MVSVTSQHPELVNAPYVATGFSAGGGFAITLLTRDPNRTIAVGIVCARYNMDIPDPSKPGDPPHGPAPAAVMVVPSILIFGERKTPAPDVASLVPPGPGEYRPKGALSAGMALEGYGHQFLDPPQERRGPRCPHAPQRLGREP